METNPQQPAADIFEMKVVVRSTGGENFDLVYREEDPLAHIEGKYIREVRALCFCDGKLVVVYEPKKGGWNFPGGKVEPEEKYQDATTREIQEETNMEILQQKVIGYQDSYGPEKVTPRYVFSYCEVASLGDFIADPDGDVREIKLIDPAEYGEYVNWGEIGDRVMARALEMATR